MSEHQPEQDADELEQRSEALAGEIDETRQDWEAKKADRNVPGAPPDPEDRREPEPGDPANLPAKEDE